MVAFTKLLVITALAATATLSSGQGTLVGVDQPYSLAVKPGQSLQQVISHPNASYVAVHFSEFNLPQGDVVTVRSPDSRVAYSYTGLGRADTGLTGGFYASYIPGDEAIVEYTSVGNNTISGSGFTIDKFAHGYEHDDGSKCGQDGSEPGMCFLDNGRYQLARAKAAARMLIQGRYVCTGWLVGSQRHLLTSNRCIPDANAVNEIDIEFLTYGWGERRCREYCNSPWSCHKQLAATTATFIANNEEHNWALLQLPESVNWIPFGFLRLREDGPKIGERVYITQHPRGLGQRIAAYGKITDLNFTSTCGTEQVGYDTHSQGDSFGSPVLSDQDHGVVALHHCGGCENSGVSTQKIVADFKKQGIMIPDLLKTPNDPPLPTALPTHKPTPVTSNPTSAPLPTASPTTMPTPAPTSASGTTTPSTPAPQPTTSTGTMMPPASSPTPVSTRYVSNSPYPSSSPSPAQTPVASN